VNVTPVLKNLGHPLYKIFEDIPAGSSLPAVGRGFHPSFSEALQKIKKKFSIFVKMRKMEVLKEPEEAFHGKLIRMSYL
jgi:hypothetical protein